MIEKDLDFEKKAKLQFQDKTLLKMALTHASLTRRYRSGRRDVTEDNERLEFFGDAVLKLLVSEYLYTRYPQKTEGELSKLRAKLVSDSVIAQVAKQLDLGTYIRFSKGERLSGGAERISNLADTLEAILGAYFLDQGLEKTQAFYYPWIEASIKALAKTDDFHDFKTDLQEVSQINKSSLPQYTVIKEEGPDHKKTFHVQGKLSLASKAFEAVGEGPSKKLAERAVAKKILKQIEEDDPSLLL